MTFSHQQFVHYLPGGGLGDVFREAYYHNALGILKRWKLQNPANHLRLVLMSHNPSVADFFVGQDWIDELDVRRFPLEVTWDWERCYQLYPDAFAGRTEVRFTLPERRTLYSSAFAAHRPRGGPVVNLTNVGTAWDFPLDAVGQHCVRYPDPLVIHPFAGQAARAFPEDLRRWVEYDLRIDRCSAVTVGADYARKDHGPEEGAATIPPRALVAQIRRAKAVIATESSVYYIASMLGVPTCMYYGEGTAFHKMASGNPAWDWFFNTRDPRALFLPLAHWQAHTDTVRAWLAARLED
jgi:hypothetical protein